LPISGKIGDMNYEVRDLDQAARIREKEESRERDRVRLDSGSLNRPEFAGDRLV